MEVNFVDKSGKDVPFAEGSKLAKILGFGDVLSVLYTSSAFAPEDALGSLAALKDKDISARLRYDRETGKWAVSASLGPRSIEIELVPYATTLGDTKWKAVVKLPCEWSPGLSALVDAVDAVAERLEGEVRALREELEQLKARLAQAQPQATRPAFPPLDEATARRVARVLHALADTLHELADAAEEPFEEEEEEEDEW